MKIRSLCCAALVALPLAATAGSRITYRNADGAGTRALLVGSDKIRIDADAGNRIIIDPDQETIMILHLAERTYIRIDRASLRRWIGEVNGMLDQVDALIANVPPELRGGVRNLIGASSTGGEQTAAIVDSGRRDEVVGHRCSIWSATRNGEPVADLCLGDLAAWQLSGPDAATIVAASTMLRSWSGELSRGALARHLRISPLPRDRVPLGFTDRGDGATTRWHFDGSDAFDVDAKDFAVPTGFRERAVALPAFDP